MTGKRANETARLRDYGTTGRRDHGTTGLLKNPGVLRRSQSCVAVRGSLASEWCRCGAKSKFGWMGVYLAYIPIQADEGSAADDPLSQKLLGVRRAPSATLGKNGNDAKSGAWVNE